jgi:hypothetical protein
MLIGVASALAANTPNSRADRPISFATIIARGRVRFDGVTRCRSYLRQQIESCGHNALFRITKM